MNKSMINKFNFNVSILCILLFLAPTLMFGQIKKYSNEFLSLGIGARALAMGNCQVALASDVYSIYWNPAGLGLAENDLQFSLMHSEYFAGIAKYDFGGLVLPTKDERTFLGFGIIRFAIDDIPNTLLLLEPDGSVNYDNVTSFSAADYAFVFSVARLSSSEGLRFGANFKTVHRQIGQFANSWGFGLDGGLQLDRGQWKFGLMARDITTTFNAWSFNFTEEEKEVLAATENLIPENSLEITMPSIVIGANYEYAFLEKYKLRPSVNLALTTDGKRNVLISADPFSIDPRFGLEFVYSDVVFVRGGVNNFQRFTEDLTDKEVISVQPNFGLGLKIKSVNVDYAFTNVGGGLQNMYSHVFSLSVSINKQISSEE